MTLQGSVLALIVKSSVSISDRHFVGTDKIVCASAQEPGNCVRSCQHEQHAVFNVAYECFSSAVLLICRLNMAMLGHWLGQALVKTQCYG